MKNELGSRAKSFTAAKLASTSLIVVACASTACLSGCSSATTPPDSQAMRLQKFEAANVGTGNRSDASASADRPQMQTVSMTAHHKAQKIYLKGLEIFEQKEYDLAYLEFTRALDVDPNYHLAWFKKGLCAYYKQRYDLEIDCYRRCLEIQPDHLDALVNLANAYLAQDQLERAVPIYRRILALEPSHPVALYNLGICYYDLQDYVAAVEHLHRFIDAHPQDPGRGKAEELIRRSRAKHDAIDTQR